VQIFHPLFIVECAQKDCSKTGELADFNTKIEHSSAKTKKWDLINSITSWWWFMMHLR